MRKIDITGQRFGSVVVIKDDGYGQNPRVTAKCDCGKIFRPFKNGLKTGRTKSCGCKLVRYNVNKRVGMLVIIERLLNKKVKCRCDCGKIVIRNINSLSKNNTPNCGCLSYKNLCETHGRFVTVNGQRKILAEWAKTLGVTRERVRQLHNKGRLVKRIEDKLNVG